VRMPSPIAVPIELTAAEREQLESWERRRTTAQALALRSRIVLAAETGESSSQIAVELGVSVATVRKWRNRFAKDRLDGLVDEPRTGRPRTITDQTVDEVIIKPLETKPKDATHWSTRSMAREIGLTQTAVHDIWRAFGLRPISVSNGWMGAVGAGDKVGVACVGSVGGWCGGRQWCLAAGAGSTAGFSRQGRPVLGSPRSAARRCLTSCGVRRPGYGGASV